jgi:hypothetical protein
MEDPPDAVAVADPPRWAPYSLWPRIPDPELASWPDGDDPAPDAPREALN